MRRENLGGREDPFSTPVVREKKTRVPTEGWNPSLIQRKKKGGKGGKNLLPAQVYAE